MGKGSIVKQEGVIRRKLIAMWGSLLVGLLIIGYVAARDMNVTVGQSAGALTSEEIQGNVTVGQTFIAPYPGLSRIAVRIRTFSRSNSHEVIFHLRQGREAQTDIFTASFNARDVRDRKWQSFSFPALSDSAGATYYFYFESPQSTPGNAIAVMGQPGDPYPDGVAYVRDEALPGDMAFKTYYKVLLQERFDFLLARLTANKPSLWGSRYFYVGLGLIYLVLSIACLAQIGRLDEMADMVDDDR
jgi:hypothetical protein